MLSPELYLPNLLGRLRLYFVVSRLCAGDPS